MKNKPIVKYEDAIKLIDDDVKCDNKKSNNISILNVLFILFILLLLFYLIIKNKKTI